MGDQTLANAASASEQNEQKPQEPAAKPLIEFYMVRLSPTCRAVWLFLLQHNIPHVLLDVDFSNAKKEPTEFLKKYPHKEVPLIVDGDLVVFDGHNILRYLSQTYANGTGFGYTIQTKLLCESLLSWANAELHRVVGYNYSYPGFLDKYQLPDEAANECLIETGIRQLTQHLERLETGYLANKRYLTGDRLTVADTYVATILLQAEWMGFKFNLWSKVVTWLRRVKDQEYWSQVHESHNKLLEELKEAEYTE